MPHSCGADSSWPRVVCWPWHRCPSGSAAIHTLLLWKGPTMSTHFGVFFIPLGIRYESGEGVPRADEWQALRPVSNHTAHCLCNMLLSGHLPRCSHSILEELWLLQETQHKKISTVFNFSHFLPSLGLSIWIPLEALCPNLALPINFVGGYYWNTLFSNFRFYKLCQVPYQIGFDWIYYCWKGNLWFHSS